MISKPTNQVRVRFAPSPTGFLHIGGLRTAFYNYLFAKQNNGQLILRIEDTDRERYVEGAIESLLRTLKAVDLEYDEGPGEKQDQGEYGPYKQSERLELYKKYAEQLLAEKKAYRCYCRPEELDRMRQRQREKKEAPRYDGRCRSLTEAAMADYEAANTPHVIRFWMPQRDSVSFKDKIYGQVTVETKNLDDQVLLKSDGYPTYHLANVVDDHLMEISHVIRGEEWLPSTPKHVLLYEAFNWPVPEFIHLPLLLNADKSKLSKRQGDVSVQSYLDKGFLPEALLNYLALLGWNPGTEQEIFSRAELLKDFSIAKVQKAGAIFDLKKLEWLNGEYLRRLPLAELAELCAPYLENYKLSKDKLTKAVKISQERLKKLSDIEEIASFLFDGELVYETELLNWKKNSAKDSKVRLEHVIKALKSLEPENFTEPELEKLLFEIIEEEDLGKGDTLWPMRVALSGLRASPGPFEIAEVLGKKESLSRLQKANERLSKA